MSEQVMDFSLATIRIPTGAMQHLSHQTREMLRMYSSRSWYESIITVFDMANYRIAEVSTALNEDIERAYK